MKYCSLYLVLAFYFLWSHNISFSQCSPPRSDDCAGAKVLCGLGEMNGYTCQNADYPNTEGPPSLCPGWGPPTNIGWWAFVTSGGNVCITVNYSNCTFPPPGGTNGIQLGIYEDCSFNNLIICDATCPGPIGTKTICGNLTACKVYYFFVDGCNGDVCDFTLSTTGGASPTLDPIGKINNDVDRKIEVCKGACNKVFQVKAQSGSCAATYIWTLDGVEQASTTNTITLDFPDEGSFEICASAIIGTQNSICDIDGPECATIIVKKNPDKKGGPNRICPEKIPYTWHQQTIDATGTYRNEFMDVDCCIFDSVVDFIVLPVPIPPDIYHIGCNSADVYKDPTTGIVYNSCENQTLIALPASSKPYSCDSTYVLTAIFLNFNVAFEQYCIDQFIEISPQISNLTRSCNGGESYSFTYKWYLQNDPMKNTLGTDEKIQVSKKDDYCLELTVDTRLGTMNKVCKFNYCESLNEDRFNINKICPTGDTLICAGSTETYFIDSIFAKDVTLHHWRVIGGTIITTNPFDTSIIEVKWSNQAGKGNICYSYETNCGVSPECCQNIEIVPAPNPNAGQDQIICGLSTTFTGTKDIGGEWKIIKAPGNVNINNFILDKSDVSVDQYGDYYFIWEETNLSCTTADSVILSFKPDPSKDKEIFICGGNNQDYIMKFQILGGIAPYTLIKGNGTIDASNVYTSGVIRNLTKDTVEIADINGCSFIFIHDYECKCLNQIGRLENTPQNLCENEILNVLYDPTGEKLDSVPPDTLIFFIYTNPSDPIGSKIKNISALDINYDPTYIFGQIYYVAAYLGRKNGSGGIDINLGCVRITSGKPFTFYKIPTPNAGIDESVCGTNFNLNGINSIPGSKITWRIISGGGVIFTDINAPQTMVNIQGNYGTYIFEIEEENQNICRNTDQVAITFNSSPDIIQLDKICVDFNVPGKYLVKANIQGGTAPYTLISVGGKIINGQWCSDTLTSLTQFDILIEDKNGCRTPLVQDNYNCNCGIIDAGILDTTITILCQDQCITIKSIAKEQIDLTEDAVMYVIHSGFYKNALDTFYSLNDLICFNPTTMMLGGNNVYYISRLVGDDITPKDGIVDSKDPCLRVSNNQPVIWEPYPVADAGRDISVCGLANIMQANLSLGSGTWVLLSGPGTANFLNPNLPNTSVQVNQFGTYLYKWEVQNNNCLNIDTISITYVDAPEFISNSIIYECDDVAEKYKLKVTSQNGDKPSWRINAFYNTSIPLLGQFNNQEWESDWIPTDSNFLLFLNDKNNCNTDTLNGSFDCQCITRFGILNKIPLSLCEGNDATTLYTSTNSVLDANDGIRYMLYDGIISDPINGTPLSINTNGVFAFDPNKMQLNKKYFIAVFVGNVNPTNGDPIFTDRCLQFEVVEVTWYAKPISRIVGPNVLNCKSTSINLNGSSSTTGTGNPAQYFWSTSNGRFVNPNQIKSDNVDIDQPGTYTLEITDPLTGCIQNTNWYVNVDRTRPNVQIEIPEVLTCDKVNITLNGNASSQGNFFYTTWSGPGIVGNNNGYIVNVETPGIYILKIQNSDNGCLDSLTVNVLEDKKIPTSKILSLGSLSCTVDQIQLDGSASTGNSGSISTYSWSTINGNILAGLGTQKITVGKPGGIFILSVKDSRNGCLDTDTISIIEVGNPLKEILINPKDASCFGKRDGVINILNVLDVNNQILSNLQFSFNGGAYSNTISFTNLALGNYSITAKDNNGCQISKIVNINEPQKLNISVVKTIIVNQGDLVRLESLLNSISGGTKLNGAYKDTSWYNINEQKDWEPFLNYIADKTRDFLITGIDQSDCQVSEQIKVIVRIVREVWWPTAFSPNGDGTNDVFNVYGKNISNIKVLNIFDRWGEMVYSEKNLQVGNATQNNQGWNGIFRGERSLPGVYTFYAELQYVGENTFEKIAGEFTLIR